MPSSIHKTLYRKYRPLSLEAVVGQDGVTTPLKNAIKSGKFSHAYLFIGPRGTGKTTVARIFAHEINNFKYEVEDSYVDIIEIDAATYTSVDNIRDLRETAVIAPSQGKYKVYIIDEVHMLSRSAFNALLKILEEPPTHVIFIMATTDSDKVPATIKSRSELFTFHLAEEKIMADFLTKIAKKEKISIKKEAVELVAKLGGGSFRDSLSLLDQISTITDSEITVEIINSSLGLPSDEIIKNLLKAHESSDINGISHAIKSVLNSGTKPESIATDLIKFIINNPEQKYLPLLSKLTDVKPPFVEAKLLLALSYTPQQTTINSTPVIRQASTVAKEQNAKKNEIQIAEKPKQAETTIAQPEGKNSLSEDDFMAKVSSTSIEMYSKLQKTTIKIEKNTLIITPNNKIIGRVLSEDKNLSLLKTLANGLTVVIDGSDNKAPSTKSVKNTTKFDQIRDIMGGEITEISQDGSAADPFA